MTNTPTQRGGRTSARGRIVRQARPKVRPDQDLVDMVILDFPVKLKRALVRVADKQKSNMTNVAVAALAEHFGIEFVPTFRRSRNHPGDSSQVSFAMPRKLRHAIQVEAAEREITRSGLVVEILAGTFLAKAKK